MKQSPGFLFPSNSAIKRRNNSSFNLDKVSFWSSWKFLSGVKTLAIFLLERLGSRAIYLTELRSYDHSCTLNFKSKLY